MNTWENCIPLYIECTTIRDQLSANIISNHIKKCMNFAPVATAHLIYLCKIVTNSAMHVCVKQREILNELGCDPENCLRNGPQESFT